MAMTSAATAIVGCRGDAWLRYEFLGRTSLPVSDRDRQHDLLEPSTLAPKA